MTTITESTATASFLISEANGNRSRDNGILTNGQDLPAGAVLKLATGKFVEVTSGDEGDACAILLAATDASGGDTACAVIARDAEVNGEELNWNTDSPAPTTATAIAALADFGIIVR